MRYLRWLDWKNKFLYVMVLLFVLMQNGNVHAQNSKTKNAIDSLTQLLSKTVHDSVKASVESELAYQYDLISETPSAIKYYEQAIEHFLAVGDSLNAGINLRWLGMTCQYDQRLDQALPLFIRSVEILERTGNKNELATTHLYFADFFRDQRDLTNAMKELSQAQKVLQGSAATGIIANTHMMAGLLFIETNSFDSALQHFFESARLFTIDGNMRRKGLAHYNAANMLIEKKQFNLAIVYLDSASTHLNLEDLQMVCSLNRLYAAANIGTGNIQKAIDHANRALDVSEKSTLSREKMGALDYLWQAYKAKGDYKKALEYHEQYSIMVDSIYDADKSEQIANLNARYESNKKEQQLAAQEATITLQETKANQLIVGIVFAIVLAGVVLIAFVQKARSNKKLAKQKSEIEKQNAERELLLKEIHHRVKNNLQVISSLLSMQSRNMEEGDARDAVREGQGRIKSMSLIHQKLYSEANLSKINMKEYLEELSEFLFKSYKPGGQVVKNIEAEELLIDVDTAVPLGLIVNELISNALKYAFDPVSGGTLNVLLEKNEEEFVLRVSDSGKGLPAGFENGKSMGMKLVKTLVQQIEGTLQIENSKGAHFHIRFKGLNVA